MENKSPWVKIQSEIDMKEGEHLYEWITLDGCNKFASRLDKKGAKNKFPVKSMQYLDESLFAALQSEVADLKGQNEALIKRYIRIENRKQEQRKVIKDLLVKAATLQSENARLQNEVDQLKASIEVMEANYYSPDEITAIKEASYHAGKVGGYY